jgi:hypothetical protein
VTHITQEQFNSRFVALIIGGGSFLKKKVEDRHILLISAALSLDKGRHYSEAELNEALKPWSAVFGDSFGLDHVTMRRYLIDERYILRDAAGTAYTLNTEDPPVTYDEGIAELDLELMLADAQREREERKRKYMQSQDQ